MLNRSNKVKKVILAILSVVAILGIATTATKIANNQKTKVMPASTHVTGQYDLVQPGDENRCRRRDCLPHPRIRAERDQHHRQPARPARRTDRRCCCR